MVPSRTTPFFAELRQKIQELGGLLNAHLHLDRAGTYHRTLELIRASESEGSHLSIAQKHAIIPMVHGACYEPAELTERVDGYLQLMVDVGTTRADTVVDVTYDNVRRQAFDCLMGLKARRKNEIDFRVGAYSPLGFRDDEPGRWELLTEVAREADFLGSLPERDDKRDYPEHIGFDENCRRMLLLSADLDKQLHIHVDQQNHAFEDGCERVARLTRELGLGVAPDREPRTWLIHAISPSAYDEERFEQLIETLAELNIGIICCPSAAVSMRQIRPLMAATHNSIARVLEMLAAGIQVRVGSDNICDITSPASTTDLVDELFVLSNAVRYYDVDILAKIGAGVPLHTAERGRLKVHLDRDFAAAARVAKRYEEEALELSPLS